MHPYTRALAAAVPVFDPAIEAGRRLKPADETALASGATLTTSGCPYRPRCPFAEDVCSTTEPELVELRPGQLAACHVVARIANEPSTKGVWLATTPRRTPWVHGSNGS